MKLYGIRVSNYYNMVRHSLLLKGVDFEEVTVMPNQEADYLAKSPLGKVPCIETADGFLSETNVILEYLEETYPATSLMPSAPWERAKVRELMKAAELYVELPARRHLNEVLFGGGADAAAHAEVRAAVEKGLKAISQLLSPGPYALGDKPTYADIVLLHTFALAGLLMQSIYDWDIVSEVAGLAELLERVSSTPEAQQVITDRQAAFEAFMASQG